MLKTIRKTIEKKKEKKKNKAQNLSRSKWFIKKYIQICNVCRVMVISRWLVLFVEETGENHRSTASHWQTLLHNVVLSTPRHHRKSNSQRCWW